MRLGHAWRVAVLASMALFLSGQLCMLTTCVPRLARVMHGSHACCEAPGRATSPAAPAPATHGMPCGQQLLTADASVSGVDGPALIAVLPMVEAAAASLPIARIPIVHADTGPPVSRTLPATAGLRAPPQG